MKRSLLVVIAALLAAAPAAAERVYKWVDKNGVTHYGDHVPAEYAREERHVLNRQGVAVDVLEAQKTSEQLAEEARLAAIERDREEQRLRAERRDRVLLESYTAVSDIERLRDARLADVDAQMELTNSYIDDIRAKVTDLEARGKQFEDQGKKRPPYIDDDIASALESLAVHEGAMISHYRKRVAIRTQFAREIVRYRELRGMPASDEVVDEATDNSVSSTQSAQSLPSHDDS